MSNHSYVLQAKTGEKTVSVNLAWDYAIYEFEELYAKHKSNRIAKSGEVLYLVDPPSVTNTYKEVRFGFTTNPPSVDDSKMRNVKWYKDEDRPENQLDINKKEIIRKIKEDDNTTTFVEAGNPERLTKNVTVQWVDGDYSKVSITPVKIKDFAGGFNSAAKRLILVLDIITGCETQFNGVNVNFAEETLNEEDLDSRFYNNIKRKNFTLGSGFSTECFVRGTAVKLWKFKVGVVMKSSLTISGTFVKKEYKRFDQNKFILLENPIYRADGKLKLGAGLGADILDTKNLTIKGSATINGGGGITFKTLENNAKFNLYARMLPVTAVLAANFTVKVSGWEYSTSIDKTWKLYENDKRWYIYKNESLSFFEN